MYGLQFATRTNAARPSPSSSSSSSKRALRLRGPLGRDLDERDVPRPAAVGPAAELVDLPHELRIEPEARVEAEATTVHAPQADPPGRPERDPLAAPHGVSRKAERPGEHARSAAGEEPERDVDLDAVQHLVVGAISAEDVQRVDLACLPGDLGGVAGHRREPRLDTVGERRLHRREAVLIDA